MQRGIQTIWMNFRAALLVVLVELIAVQPILVQFTPTASAAEANTTTSQYHDDTECFNVVDRVFNPKSSVEDDISSPADEEVLDPTAAGETNIMQSFNLTEIKKDESIPQETRDKLTDRARIDTIVSYYDHGITYYKMPANAEGAEANSEWVFVCDTAPARLNEMLFSPFATASTTALDVIDTIIDPLPRIGFKNVRDQFAVLGESCPNGFSKPYSEWYTNGTNPCINFSKEDDYFANDQWDAPKVTNKVLATLAYLVTPASRGGAGRDYIRVSKVIQTTDDNELGSNLAASESDSTSSDANAASNVRNGGDTDTSDPLSILTPSSYQVNLNDSPFKPVAASSSLMIDEVDRVRTSTKIEEKRLFGNNTVNYQYEQPFALKVAWQTDQGLADNPPPDFSKLSMLQSSRFLTNAAIVQMLNQYGLGDLEIDVSEVDINDFGDVALVVGQSLLEQLLGSPNGSMKGWDLLSTLQSIGLTYVEQQLGLVPGALSDRNPLDREDTSADYDHVVRDIGRTTVEYILGFPRGSLYTSTGTSQELLESVGRRYLEQEVFKVSSGTLTATEGRPLNTISDLLERLGEGRIEAAFKLPKQSLGVDSYAKFRQSSYKAGLLFPNVPSNEAQLSDTDYMTADYVSNKLNLAYTPYSYQPVDAEGNKSGALTKANTNMYGFTAAEFEFAPIRLAPGNIQRFKQLVGSRVIETSIGIFRREGTTQRIPTEVTGAPPTTISINGHELNGQNVPLMRDDAYEPGKAIDWCDAHSRRYASGTGIKGQESKLFNGSNFDEAIAHLSSSYDADSDWNGTEFTVNCTTDVKAAQSQDLGMLTQIQDYLFNQNKVSKTVFFNQESAPQSTDFSGSFREHRYNTALLLYYNDPDNNETYDYNVINGKDPESIASPDDNGNVTTTILDSQVPLAQVLNEIANGTDSAKSGFKFTRDEGLIRRLNSIRTLMQQNESNHLFDLERISSLSGAELDNAIIDRLNILTVKPYGQNFASQYEQAEFNGWLFQIEDLKGRLGCKLNNTDYVLASDGLSYTCGPKTGATALDKDALNKVQEAIKLVDRLYKAPWTMVSTLIASLDAGAALDPSGFEGQSMWSAAVGLSGMVSQMDENWRFLKTPTNTGQDPMRALIAPARNTDGTVPLNTPLSSFFTVDIYGDSPLTQIGKQFAAKKFSDDPLAQRNFAATLENDFARLDKQVDKIVSAFDDADEKTKNYGIDQNSLLDKGLANGDFQRIFMLDGANAVFERVGKEELLRTVWNRSGAAEAIKSSDQYANIIRQAQVVSQKISFYQTRIEKVESLVERVVERLETLDSNPQLAKAKSALQAARAKNRNRTVTNTSIKDLQKITKSYEPAINILRGMEKTALKEAEATRKDVTEIDHLISEIIAGKELPRSQDSNFKSNITGKKASNDVCFKQTEIIDVIIRPDVLGGLRTLAEKAGGCQVDEAFGMPNDTTYTWYKLGVQKFPPLVTRKDLVVINDGVDTAVELVISEVPEATRHLYEEVEVDGVKRLKPRVPTWNANTWNVDNLKLAIGIADRNSKGAKINVEDLYKRSATEINNLYNSGGRLVELTILAKLSELIPGVRKFARQYRLTTQDFVAIMKGDMRPLIGKVGGQFIDQALNLPPGSANSLIYPQCVDNNGAKAKCNNDPNQAGTDPDNIRMQTLASFGLRELGLTVPNFPTYFNFTSGGNLMENWGNASISEDLGISPNSFKGRINALASTSDTNFDAICAANPIRCENNTFELLDAFGMSRTPFVQNSSKIVDAMREVAAKYLPESMNNQFTISIQNQINRDLEKITFARLYNDDWKTKGYWGNPDQPDELIAADYADYTNTILRNLWQLPITFKDENPNSAFNQNIVRLMHLALMHNQGELGDSAKIKDTLYDEPTLPDIRNFDTSLFTRLIDRYKTYITHFQRKVTTLNQEYQLVRDPEHPNNDNSFHRFLQGDIEAATIAKGTGTEQSINKILGTEFDKYIDENAPQEIKELNQAFKYLTADPSICGTETGFGAFTAKLMTNTTSTCSFSGLKTVNINEILYSKTGNYANLRGLIFDKYLSNIFSAKVERDIGFRQGTFRAIAADPKRGNQILLTEGVMMATDRIFGKGQRNDPCQYQAAPDDRCVTYQVKEATRQAFLAGFYDSYKKEYTTDFRISRSVKAFNTQMNQALDRQLGRIGKHYIGVEISRADFNLMTHGDNRAFSLLAQQYIANRLNQNLFRSDAGKHPLAKRFAINYNDIRDAAGLPAVADVRKEQKNSEYDFLVNQACMSDKGLVGITDPSFCYSVPRDTLMKWYKQEIKAQRLKDLHANTGENGQYTGGAYISDVDTNGDALLDENELTSYENRSVDGDRVLADDAAGRVRAAGENNLNTFLHDRQIRSQEKVKYQMLDIIAFMKDQNIPVGFTQRMFSRYESDRVEALSEYAFNTILSGDSDMGNFLQTVCSGEVNRQECFRFFRDLGGAITAGDDSPARLTEIYKNNLTFINIIDNQFNVAFENAFDVKLPAGTFKGIYGWAMAGFKKGDFNKEEVCVESAGEVCKLAVVPVGRVLEDWGIGKLTTWGDKQLGLKKGTSAKIVRAVQLISTIQRLTSTGHQIAQEISFYESYMISEGYDPEVFNDFAKADKDLAKTQAALRAAQAELARLAGEIIAGYFSDQLAEGDEALGLPQGTMQMLAQAGATWGTASIITGGHAGAILPGFWTLLAIQLGFQLVTGVVSVEVTNRATADGYYPFYNYGKGAAAKKGKYPYPEQPTTDYETGQFDPTVPAEYRAGLKKAAQEKVKGLLLDLMRMPTSTWAVNNGIKPKDIWIEQIFTYGSNDFNPLLDPRLAIPQTSQAGWRPITDPNDPFIGWDTYENRCTALTYDSGSNTTTCNVDQTKLAGVWAVTTSLKNGDKPGESIHIRW